MKYENRRLKEDVDDMSAELEELAKLKKIVENNLEEALATVVQEREQKHSLKKELDQRLKSDSLYALQSLVNFGLADGRRIHDNVEDSPALKRIEGEFSSGDSTAVTSRSPTSTIPEAHSVVGDLFSEIHVTEVRKLEKLLEDVEIEKSELQTKLDEMRERLQLAEEELGARDATVEQLKTQLVNSTAQPTASDRLEEESLQEQTDICHQGGFDVEGHTTEEISRLQNCTAEQDEQIRRLEADLTVMTQLATESKSTLSSTQDSLVQVTEEIANLYHLVCQVNGETPNRLTLEHVQGKPGKSVTKPKTTVGSHTSTDTSSGDVVSVPEASVNSASVVEEGKEQQQPDSSTDRQWSLEKEESRGDPIACCKLVETINDQIKFLRGAVERSVELSRQRQNESGSSTEETADMAEQIIKLKAMLSAKREQVSSLL